MPSNKRRRGKKNGIPLCQQQQTDPQQQQQQPTIQDVGLPSEIWVQIALLLPPRNNVNLQCVGRHIGSCAAYAHDNRLLEAMTQLGQVFMCTPRFEDETYRLCRLLYSSFKQDNDYTITILAYDKALLRKTVCSNYYSIYKTLWKKNAQNAQTIIVPLVGRMQNGRGVTMLHVAAMNGDVEIAKTLMCTYGIPPGISDWEGDPPIFLAASTNHVDVVSLLVEHGVDPQAVCVRSLGHTPLHVAVTHGCIAVAQWLLEHGVNPNLTTTHTQTALHLAMRDDNDMMVRLLIQYNADIYALDECGDSPLNEAVLSESYKSLKVLQDMGADCDDHSNLENTELQNAIIQGDVGFVHNLLNTDVDVNIPNTCGMTALHTALRSSSCQMWIVALHPNADFTCKDNFGRTPLDCAKLTISYCDEVDKKKLYNMILETARSSFKH